MAGQMRELISFYVSSISNAYWDALPEKISDDAESMIASGVVDETAMNDIHLECWIFLDQNFDVVLKHLRLAGLEPYAAPEEPVQPKDPLKETLYTDAELDLLVRSEEFALAIYDAILESEQAAELESSAALASIIATTVLYHYLRFRKWPFELVFPILLRHYVTLEDLRRPELIRDRERFWTIFFKELDRVNKSFRGLLKALLGYSWETREDDQLVVAAFVAFSQRDNFHVFTDLIAEFRSRPSNLELIWQAVLVEKGRFENGTGYLGYLARYVPIWLRSQEGTSQSIEFTIALESEHLGIVPISALMLHLNELLSSFGFLDLQLIDVKMGSLWQRIRAAFSGDPKAAEQLLDEAFEGVREALQSEHVSKPKAEAAKNFSESTKLQAEAILALAEAEKLRRAAPAEEAAGLETLARAARLVAEAEEIRARASLLKAQAAQIREETASRKAHRLRLLKGELAQSIQKFDRVEVATDTMPLLKFEADKD